MFFVSAREIPVIAYGAFIMFLVLALLIGLRFIVKGPEHERAQPFMRFTSVETHLGNIEPAALQQPGLRAIIEAVTANRRALPAPEGIFLGSSADLGAVRALTEKEAREILIQDDLAVKTKLPLDSSGESQTGTA